MSYQKKSLILQQLEQAIKKKAQEKSRNKQQLNRALQGSIEKKKNVLKTATNKETRVESIHKNSDTASKKNLPDKPVSIFNNEHMNVFESTEFKAKKYNNRRLDKLVSLIQYMVSSSEKALRYISSTNFEAEFALKLYRSDRQNLVNQLKNLNFDDIIDSQRTQDKGGKSDQAYNMLLQENNKLKKEILILEKEAESYHHKVKDNDSITVKQHQKQINKLKEMLRKLIPFEAFKQMLQLLEKENKFQIMAIKSQQNSKKTTQIQIVLSSLENQRTNIIQNLGRTTKQGKTDRTYKLNQIQAEKQQLQRQLAQMKIKLTQIIDSGKSVNQLQFLKKNSELITEKLSALHKELSPNATAKRNSQQIIEHIRVLALNLQSKNQQLNQVVNSITQQNDSLKQDIDRLKQQKKQLENDARSEGDEVRMENMLSQIQKLRDIVDELGQGQQISSQRILELEEQLKSKQEHIADISSQLSQAVQKADEFKGIISQLNKQIIQIQNQFNRTINENAALNEKLRATQNDIISNSYSKDELKTTQAEKQSLLKKLQAANNRNNYLQQQIKQLESQMIEKDDQLEQLNKKLLKENTDFKYSEAKSEKTVKQLNSIKQELDFIKAQKVSMQKQIQQQRQRHKTEFENLNNLLQEAQMQNIAITKQKMQACEKLELQRQNIEALNKKIRILEEEIKELQDQIRSLTIISNEAMNERQHSKDLLNHIEEQRQNLKIQLNNAKQQMEDHSEIIRSKNKQYVNLLKQILKGLLLQPSEYADKNTFEELLEFGSQQVVQIRKRQREEESNKRKNVKREYDNILSDFNENQQSLEECKVRLFQQSSQNLFQKKQPISEAVDIEEFNELKEQANDSMLSQQYKQHHDQEANLSQFNDHQEQKMSQSMVSNDLAGDLPETLNLNSNHHLEEQTQAQRISESLQNNLVGELPQKLSLNSVHLSQQSKKITQQQKQIQLITQIPEKLSLNSVHNQQQKIKDIQIINLSQKQHKYALTQSQIQEEGQNISQFGQIEQNVSDSMISENPIQIKIIQEKVSKKDEDLLLNQIHYSNENGFKQQKEENNEQYGISGGLQNASMLFQAHLNLQNSLNNSQKRKQNRAQQGYSKHTLLSIAIKDEKLDLDQFQQVKSFDGNNSFVSNNDNIDSHRDYVFKKQDRQQMGKSDVQVIPLNVNQLSEENEGMIIQQFQGIDPDPMSQSMISDKVDKQGEDINIDEFGELAERSLSESMMSIQQKKQTTSPLNQVHSPVSNGMGLQEFKQLDGEPLSESMISHKSEKQEEEHNIDQFGEMAQSALSSSMISVQQKKQDNNNNNNNPFLDEVRSSASKQSQNLGIDEFGQVQNQMNNSILSQKQSEHADNDHI